MSGKVGSFILMLCVVFRCVCAESHASGGCAGAGGEGAEGAGGAGPVREPRSRCQDDQPEGAE